MISESGEDPNDLLKISNTFSLKKQILTINLDDTSDEEDQETSHPSREPFFGCIKNEECSWNESFSIKNEGNQTYDYMNSEQTSREMSSAQPNHINFCNQHYFGFMKKEEYEFSGSSFMENEVSEDKNKMMFNNLDLTDHSFPNQLVHSIDQKLDLMKEGNGWARTHNFDVYDECLQTQSKTEPSTFAYHSSNISESKDYSNKQSNYSKKQIFYPEFEALYDKVMKDEEQKWKILLKSDKGNKLTDEELPGFPNYLTDKSKHFNFQNEGNRGLKSTLNGIERSLGGPTFSCMKVGHEEESHEQQATDQFYFTPLARDNGPLDLSAKYCSKCHRYTNDVLPHRSGCTRNCTNPYISYVTKSIMNPRKYPPPAPVCPPNVNMFAHGKNPLQQPSNLVYFHSPTSTLNGNYEAKININWKSNIQLSHHEQKADNLEGELFENQDLKDDASLERSVPLLSSNRRSDSLGIPKKLYPCLFCPKTFTSKAQLNGHTLYKCANKRIICTICSTRFTTNTHLMRHQESKTCKNKLFECKTCYNRYCKASALREHSSKCT